MTARHPARDMNESMRRGLMNSCPNCGKGRIFAGYLTVVRECSECGEPLGEYRAADGPAFFTICIVGLLLVPLLGFTYVVFEPEPVTLILIVTGISVVLTLVLLRYVKGTYIGYLWAHHERDPGA